MSIWKTFSKKMSDISIAEDGLQSAEFSGTTDTGCYALNALLSGSVFGGAPNNKIMAIAGDPATGKSFFALSIVKHFLSSDPTAGVLYYDTEAAITKEMLADRGIDTTRVMISEPSTIQEFRHHCLKFLDAYEQTEDKPPLLIILDSLGMLSSTKEVEDSGEGKETRDMTKAQLIRGTFRVLTLKLAKLHVPMITTLHTYDAIGAYFPTKELSGGQGIKYSASTILMLSKKKDRDADKDVIGNIIKVKLYKSRITKENSEVEVNLSYSDGLSPYYGLLELAGKYKVFKKLAKQWEMPDGTKVFEKQIWKEPSLYFTEDVMKALDLAAAKEFKYGKQTTDS